MMPDWDRLPKNMQTDVVLRYYTILKERKSSLCLKRVIDFFLALILVIVLLPIMAGIILWIKFDSRGSVFYRQERITRYGKPYRIFKFRTMVVGADKKGPLVTAREDSRITRAGQFLRRCRLDELPQLFNVLAGDMSFVGTRPEVRKYVDAYTPEMYATLLLPAGITSRTSIQFKDEDVLLEKYQKETGKTIDDIYIEKILPIKMKYNLQYLKKFSFWEDIKIMIDTVLAVSR